MRRPGDGAALPPLRVSRAGSRRRGRRRHLLLRPLRQGIRQEGHRRPRGLALPTCGSVGAPRRRPLSIRPDLPAMMSAAEPGTADARRGGLGERRMWLRWVSVAALLLVFISGPARADDVADFYRGRGIPAYIGSSTGDGTDLYGRLVASFISRHIPGNPQIVAQNMPGANGLVSANHLYNV